MTKQAMTSAQIEHAVNNYRLILEENRAKIGSQEVIQRIFDDDDIKASQENLVLKRVELLTKTFKRRVTVDRKQELLSMLKPWIKIEKRCSKQYTAVYCPRLNLRVGFSHDVVKEMPHSDRNTTKLTFFQIEPNVLIENIEEEYRIRSMRFADPYSLLQAHLDDTHLCNGISSKTFWRNSNGKLCALELHQYQESERPYPIITYARICQTSAETTGYLAVDYRNDGCESQNITWFAGVA